MDGPSKKEMKETAEFDQYVCAVNHRSEVNFEEWVDNFDLNLIEQYEEVVLPLNRNCKGLNSCISEFLYKGQKLSLFAI